MEYFILTLCIIIIILLAVLIVLTLMNKKSNTALTDADMKKVKEAVNESINILGNSISENVALRNENLMNFLNKNVEELTKKMNELVKSQESLVESEFKFKQDLRHSLSKNNEKQSNKFSDFAQKYTQDSQKQKEEIMDKLSIEIKEFNKNVKEKLEEFRNDTKESISGLKETVSNNLTEIREDNNKKLEKINESVNEKLQKTLEEKLENSFKSVVQGIGDVNKAVGEIKGLATDVGSLKNVLTNVKTKGIMGEVILGNIIKEFLTTGQYEENIATKKDSSERVEFAIKLPGTKEEAIWLPVDSKFPYESYSKIHESTNVDEINEAKKQLRANLLKYAKDVSEKYIDVPHTTDFAIMFLPIEGLYLEALNMGLFEEIQSKYKVNITGPTTFTAFVNSLNMGFKSLMIQKKSADVFDLLRAVKFEFNKFAEALDKTQKKFNQAADELDSLVGTRTRLMNAKLKSVEALDEEKAKQILEKNED